MDWEKRSSTIGVTSIHMIILHVSEYLDLRVCHTDCQFQYLIGLFTWRLWGKCQNLASNILEGNKGSKLFSLPLYLLVILQFVQLNHIIKLEKICTYKNIIFVTCLENTIWMLISWHRLRTIYKTCNIPCFFCPSINMHSEPFTLIIFFALYIICWQCIPTHTFFYCTICIQLL